MTLPYLDGHMGEPLTNMEILVVINITQTWTTCNAYCCAGIIYLDKE